MEPLMFTRYVGEVEHKAICEVSVPHAWHGLFECPPDCGTVRVHGQPIHAHVVFYQPCPEHDGLPFHEGPPQDVCSSCASRGFPPKTGHRATGEAFLGCTFCAGYF